MSNPEIDSAFDNMAHVSGSAALPGEWAQRAASFRAKWHDVQTDLPYGPDERQCFDLFLPAGAPGGLVVFVHGGYWMRLDKSYWSHLAEGALSRGWAMAIPSYSLVPSARIATITREISRAIEAAGRLIPGPILLSGHSAGGHLVTRMICHPSPLDTECLGRIAKVVTISGLHDLRPLLKASMNGTLGLDADEASSESPGLQEPVLGVPVSAWYGAAELPEFKRQAEFLRQAWQTTGVEVPVHASQGDNHFTILNNLAAQSGVILMDLLRTES